MMAPQFAALSNAYDSVNFVKIDVDNSPNLTTEERITVSLVFVDDSVERSDVPSVQEQQAHFASEVSICVVRYSLLEPTSTA